jgi:bacteriorhodopsin
VCEGGNVISPDSEAVFYGVLDFLAKPVFGALLIWGHRNIDPERIGMKIRDYEGDEVVREKERRNPANGVDGPVDTNGTNGHTATAAV